MKKLLMVTGFCIAFWAVAAPQAQSPTSGSYIQTEQLPPQIRARMVDAIRAAAIQRRPDVTPTATVLLQVEPDSDLEVPGLALTTFSDGSYGFVTVSTRRPQRQRFSETRFFAIDPATGTYSVFRWANSVPTPSEQERVRNWYTRHGSKLADNFNFSATTPVGGRRVAQRQPPTKSTKSPRIKPAAFQFICGGDWTQDVSSYDPVNIPLNLTHGQLYWEYSPGWYAYDANAPWAASPSALGTHWYVDYFYNWWTTYDPSGACCVNSYPGQAYTEARAGFHNVDFAGNTGLPVWVDSISSIWYDNGYLYMWDYWNEGGAVSGLLLHKVTSDTGYDGC